VGPISQWPQALRTAVSICLNSRFPMVLWWGRPAYTMFYNDAYRPVLGQTKHPGWLGRSGRECWHDIWDIVGPMIDSVFETGEATWSEDLLFSMDRNLPREEAYFTFSYSPIYVDREMWEKIVLNLLSNAFKFTLGGEIAVSLHWAGDHVDLTVRDTGSGIPAEELSYLFQHFHRVRSVWSRTYEGTGIGLALVQELV
jgi:histidine kinase/DNA gyrase B/HSP90-like ATPase